jgi:hypothetical protein
VKKLKLNKGIRSEVCCEDTSEQRDNIYFSTHAVSTCKLPMAQQACTTGIIICMMLRKVIYCNFLDVAI